MIITNPSKVRICITLCLTLSICGCTQTTGGSSVKAQKHQANNKAKQLMHLSEQSSDQQAVNYKLQAIEQLIAADNIELAEYSITEDLTAKNLDSANAAFKQILLARIELAKRNLTEAKQHLRSIWTPAKLPEDLLVKFYITRAEIYRRSGNIVDAVQERIYLAKHLHDSNEVRANNEAIIDGLMQLTPGSLKNQPRDAAKHDLNGWLEFAYISKQYDADSEQQMAAMQAWSNQFPNHPALKFMPDFTPTTQDVAQTFDFNQRVIHTPQKIAVLLPLNGTHAKSAQAVRDGFLAAFYAQKDSPSKPKIQVYDTSNQNVNNVYKQAVNEGADFIVGPLTKEEVDAVSSSMRAEVPVLALNSSNRSSSYDNILQFSLSPELEAQAVARKAWHDGHRNAVVIIPKSSWGKRMLSAFEKTWLTLGGKIVDVEVIASQTDLNKGIKRLLAIDSSEARAQKLKQTGLKLGFDPRRRQDIDMVFIATNAALARQVKPLLNFYFAGNLPAYASSSIYTGKNNPSLDQDLNGVQFCDMPWVLDDSIDARKTYQKVAELWPEDFEQYARLYALGLDAYKVATQIEQLTSKPHFGISGMTGMLTLDKQQAVDRKLMWASFKKGLPSVNGDQS